MIPIYSVCKDRVSIIIIGGEGGGFFKGCGSTKNDVALDILCPDQQFFSNVMLFSCLPGLNQYLAGTKHSTPVSLQLSTVRSALV